MMRRVISVALTLVLATCTSAEPALALGSEHACCFARMAAAAAEQKVSCHGHSAAQSPAISAAHSAHSECANRCCLGMASRAAQPGSSLSSAAAPRSATNVPIPEFQPLSQAQLPAPSGRAPPSRLFR